MTPRVELATKGLILTGARVTKYQLAEKVYCHHRTAQRVLQKLHKSQAICVTGWVLIYNQHIPEYGIGEGDKRRPKRFNGALHMRQKRRDNVDFYMNELMAKRMKRSNV